MRTAHIRELARHLDRITNGAAAERDDLLNARIGRAFGTALRRDYLGDAEAAQAAVRASPSGGELAGMRKLPGADFVWKAQLRSRSGELWEPGPAGYASSPARAVLAAAILRELAAVRRRSPAERTN